MVKKIALLMVMVGIFMPGIIFAGEEDARVRQRLERTDLKWSVDEDKDFKLIFSDDDVDDVHIFVMSNTNTVRGLEYRSIWAIPKCGDFEWSYAIMERMLEANGRYVMGSWVKSKNNARFEIKIPADCSAKELEAYIRIAVSTAREFSPKILQK